MPLWFALLGAPFAEAQEAEPVSAAIIGGWSSASAPSDGRSPVAVWVLAQQPDGAPSRGARLKGSSEAGTIGAFREVAPGLYTAEFVAGAGVAAGPHRVDVDLRHADKRREQVQVRVEVVAPRAARISASVTPSPLVAAANATASVSLEAKDARGAPVDGLALEVRANLGAVEPPVGVGQGRYTLRYTPKRVNYPHVELLTWVDPSRPAETWGFSVIPVQGSVDYPVKVRPRATAVVRVGERDFGPVTADANGDASVPVIVGPGASNAVLLDILGDDRRESPLDLRLPDVPRVALAPVPRGVPGDPAVLVPVRAVAVRADGALDTAAVPRFEVSSGEIAAVRTLEPGVFEADWRPAAVDTLADAKLRFFIGDAPAESVSADVLVVPRLAARIGVSVNPSPVPAGEREAVATMRVSDRGGRALSDRALVVEIDRVPVTGEPSVKSGAYAMDLDLPEAGSPTLWVGAAQVPTLNPAARVFLLADRDRLSPGGGDEVGLTVVVTDAFGVPVPGAPFSLRVDGDGQLVGDPTTDANGYGRVRYVSGPKSGLALVSADAAGEQARIALLQARPGAPSPSFPPGGRPTRFDVDWAEAVARVALRAAPETLGGALGLPTSPEPGAQASASEPPRVEAPKPRPEPDPEAPWLTLRAGLAGGRYTYQQVPSEDSGPLLPEAFVVGRPWTPSAGAVGYAVGARAWWPAHPAFGVEVAASGARYGFTAAEFGDAVAWDWLRRGRADLLARYAFSAGEARYHVAGRLGGGWSDFLYFEGNVDEASVRYRTLGVPALDAAAELGFGLGPLDVQAAVSGGFAQNPLPHALGFELAASWEVAQGVGVELGLDARKRAANVFNANSGAVYGELNDGLWTARVGAVWRR